MPRAALHLNAHTTELASRADAMDCDRVAPFYRWLEYAVFGRTLERRRAAFLAELSEARRVLALGDGDGRALTALAAAAPKARIDYVDASAKMLELARSRVGIDCVSFQQADARDAQFPSAEYDGIVTHFFFDCFHPCDLAAVIANAGRAAAPHCTWIVSEFRSVTPLARILIAIMYAFFGFAAGLKTRRLTDHHPFLQQCGFSLRHAEHSWGGMIASELWVR